MLMPVEQNVLAQAPETALNDLRTSSGLEKTDDRVYFLRNGIGQCFVCQVEFTSDELAKQHLAGKKHMKNVANGQRTVLRPGTAALHLTNQPIKTEFTPPGLQSGATGAQGNMTQPDQVSASSALCNDTSQNLLPQSPVPRRGPNGEEYQMNGTRGFCYVCNLDLTSVEHKESHIKGMKHKKKCLQTCSSKEDTADQRLAAILSNTNGVLICTLCDVPFSCLDNARQHFASNKHKKKAALKESMSTPAVEPAVRQASAANNSDGTSPKVPCGSESPFIPVTDLSTDEKISESGFFRPNLANTLPPSLQENISMRLVQPLPHRARLESQPGINTQQPGLYTWSSETMVKEVNAPIAQSGIGGNLSSNVAEIAKVKNKQLDACGPTLQSLSSEGSSVTENEKYPEVVPKSAIYPSERDSREMQRPNGYPSERDSQEMQINGYPSERDSQEMQRPNRYPSERDSQEMQRPNGYPSEMDPHGMPKSDRNPGERGPQPLGMQMPGRCPSEIDSQVMQRPNGYPSEMDEHGMPPSEGYSSNTAQSQPPLQVQPQSPLPPYTLNKISGQGYCNVCNVDLTSRQLADQHLNGQRHQKRLALWTSTQHNQTPLNPVASSTPVMPNPYPGRSSSPGTGPSPVNAEDNTGMISPVQSQQDETCFFNLRSSRGFCVACEIEITSVQHYDQHRLGKPHSRKRQRYLLSQQGKLYPLECGVCKKTFTGQESAQQHFISARHKSKVEIMGEGGRELEQLDGGRIILRDSQIWYICDICDCPLNTREQFEIHQASPRHMKTLESQMAKVELDRIVATEQIPQGNKSGASPSTRSPMAQILSEKKEENVLESNLQHLSFKPHNATSSQLMHGENQWDFAQVPNKPAGLTNAAPPSYPNYPITVGDQQGFLPTDRYAPDMREWSETTIPKQIYQSLDSSPQQTANCNIAASGGLAYYPRSTAKERTHSEYRDENTMSIGRDNSNTQPGVAYSPISIARDKTRVAGPTERAGDNSNVERNVNSESNRDSHSPATISSPCFDGGSGDSGLPGIARRPVVKRGNSNRSQGPPLRDITTMEQRLSDDETWEDSVEDADREVERANYNISESEEVAALQSNFQKLHISDPPQTDAVIVRSTKPGFPYFCKVCNRHMNTKKSKLDHEAGNLHKFNVSTIQAPRRVLPPVRNNITEKIIPRAATELTKDTPRPYQLELLEQAMVRDSVIYLPTGTGKTLVAVLAIGLMLQENKTRPILFLVDKVLLVLQQEKYIREQFEGKKFKRPDVNQDDNLIDRELLVMAICGGLFSNRGVPICKHDIIVTTADFCMNMLERGWIRWEDFSLVVLDEVHHCLKNHPYLRLFAKYHQQSQQQQMQHPITVSDNQPREHLKVLGLSASPASKVTVSQTHVMLRNLLANLGGAHMAMVEREVDDLDAYQSNAKVIPVCVPMSNNEREFTLHLLQYALRCYRQLAHFCPTLTDTATPYSYFESAVKGNDEDITRTAENLVKDIEPLMEITPCILSLQCPPEIKADQERSTLFDHLRQHLQALLLLVREIGSNSAMVAGTLLKDLASSERITLFEKHSLPCSDIRQKAAHFFKYGSKDMTMYKKLIATLNDPTYVNWADGSCKALVLIQKRQEARQHALMLRDADFVKDHQLQVSHLVGHGKGAQEGGMDVKKQKKVLDNQDRFQLIVATSIMEEGIDFQTLQLVVCMNPPTSVRALVQIRGRARKKNSHFVILCKTEEEMQKLNTLLQQEKNMAEAVRRCIEEDRGLLPC